MLLEEKFHALMKIVPFVPAPREIAKVLSAQKKCKLTAKESSEVARLIYWKIRDSFNPFPDRPRWYPILDNSSLRYEERSCKLSFLDTFDFSWDGKKWSCPPSNAKALQGKFDITITKGAFVDELFDDQITFDDPDPFLVAINELDLFLRERVTSEGAGEVGFDVFGAGVLVSGDEGIVMREDPRNLLQRAKAFKYQKGGGFDVVDGQGFDAFPADVCAAILGKFKSKVHKSRDCAPGELLGIEHDSFVVPYQAKELDAGATLASRSSSRTSRYHFDRKSRCESGSGTRSLSGMQLLLQRSLFTQRDNSTGGLLSGRFA